MEKIRKGEKGEMKTKEEKGREENGIKRMEGIERGGEREKGV